MPLSIPTHTEYARFARRNQELRQEILELDFNDIALNTGANIIPGKKSLELKYWDKLVEISFPNLEIIDKNSHQALSDYQQAMVLYYLRLADGTPHNQEWISFAELPNGNFYQTAFQSYTGQELVRQIGNDTQGFIKAAELLSAQKGSFGDAAFIFKAFPNVSLLLVHWQGDEDFPASYKILFSRSAPHYLTTDGLAILGSMLTRKITASYQSLTSKQ